MKKAIFHIAGRLINALGYEVIPRRTIDKFKWIKDIGIDTVIDVGANTGQFVEYIRRVFPNAQIYSFEPLPECFRRLVETNREDKRFKAFNLAIGDTSGTIEFHKSEFSQSSSLLPMGQLHKDNFPFTARDEVINVKCSTLDESTNGLRIGEHLLIKIDVQGAEQKVLGGAAKIVARADVVFVETNFQELYEGQPLFKEVLDRMDSEGFRYFGNTEGHLLSPINGSCLEEDSIFVNKRLLNERGTLR